MDPQTPRISGKMLPSFLGRMVYLIFDCNNVGQDAFGHALVKTTDGVDVIVQLPPGDQFDRFF